MSMILLIFLQRIKNKKLYSLSTLKVTVSRYLFKLVVIKDWIFSIQNYNMAVSSGNLFFI